MDWKLTLIGSMVGSMVGSIILSVIGNFVYDKLKDTLFRQSITNKRKSLDELKKELQVIDDYQADKQKLYFDLAETAIVILLCIFYAVFFGMIGMGVNFVFSGTLVSTLSPEQPSFYPSIFAFTLYMMSFMMIYLGKKKLERQLDIIDRIKNYNKFKTETIEQIKKLSKEIK